MNTKENEVVHFCIFKWNNRYIGICKETGFVEEAADFETVKMRLLNGTIALLGALRKSKQDLQPSVNTKPPSRYLIYFYIAPILARIEAWKGTSKGEYYFSTMPISQLSIL